MWIEDESIVEDIEIAVEEALAGIELAANKLQWVLSQCRGVEHVRAYAMPHLEGNDSGPSWLGDTFVVDLVRKLLAEVKQQRCEQEAEKEMDDLRDLAYEETQ